MPKVCEICGKGRKVGMNVSHSHNRTKRVLKPNLQRVKVSGNGRAKRIYVCTRCLRSGKVKKGVSSAGSCGKATETKRS
ncbi:MAG: 50S ribosomal protein L28 [Nitrospirota bacterium]